MVLETKNVFLSPTSPDIESPRVITCSVFFDFRWKMAGFAFLTPRWGGVRVGGLGTTYADHLRVIGKRVVDFLLVLIELFR